MAVESMIRLFDANSVTDEPTITRLRRQAHLRLWSLLTAFAVGEFLYIFAMVACCYDGVVSMMFQPVLGAFYSGIAVGVSGILGFALCRSSLRARWNRRWALAFLCTGVAVLALGSSAGLGHSYEDPETQERLVFLHPVAFLISYGISVFSVANWPRPVRVDQRKSTMV
jgi:hypothetical protein